MIFVKTYFRIIKDCEVFKEKYMSDYNIINSILLKYKIQYKNCKLNKKINY